MEMREIVSLLESKIKIKLGEISRLEKEIAIAKSVIRNDIQALYKILNTHYTLFQIGEGDVHETNETDLQKPG